MEVFGKIDIRSLWGVAGVVMVGGILAIAIFSHPAHVRVWNDIRQDIGVSYCVDDANYVGAGDTFTASGQTDNGKLRCTISEGSDYEREFCIAIPHAHDLKGTFRLSRAKWKPGHC